MAYPDRKKKIWQLVRKCIKQTTSITTKVIEVKSRGSFGTRLKKHSREDQAAGGGTPTRPGVMSSEPDTHSWTP